MAALRRFYRDSRWEGWIHEGGIGVRHTEDEGHWARHIQADPIGLSSIPLLFTDRAQ